MKQTVYLQFLPEYDAYGISDEKIAELRAQNITPLIELQPDDYLPARSLHRKNQPLLFSSDVKKTAIP